ncbi:hypothetical protein [Alloactinosynnema sp. L-07]|uniref:hypothetical protein n=1 Tax=Alloactinosynnema sp. L-07 TaxID=1653480 RepID=UPI00065F03B8|nr:hypothetical protein [Alloactinosynnema sp. L-07]CRK55650.1 hypothetical protein [Alloactinosynnema sp. L-07]
MSWNDYYRRRDAMDAVVAHAARTPESVLPYAEVPGVDEVFGSHEELLLALHYRWTLKLTGRVGLAQAEAERDASIDLVDTVSQAWRTAATEHPALRRLVDQAALTYPGLLRPALDSEQRMLALAAGLAEPHEDKAEITRVGAAFVALVRSSPDRVAGKRRNPVELLLRKLVASA